MSFLFGSTATAGTVSDSCHRSRRSAVRGGADHSALGAEFSRPLAGIKNTARCMHCLQRRIGTRVHGHQCQTFTLLHYVHALHISYCTQVHDCYTRLYVQCRRKHTCWAFEFRCTEHLVHRTVQEGVKKHAATTRIWRQAQYHCGAARAASKGSRAPRPRWLPSLQQCLQHRSLAWRHRPEHWLGLLSPASGAPQPDLRR